MAKTVTQAFKDVWKRQAGKMPQAVVRVSYKRQYYDATSPAQLRYEASWTDLDPDEYGAVGNIPWMLDTPFYNEFKATQVTITLRNEDHRWIAAPGSPSIFAIDDVAVLGYVPYKTLVRIQYGLRLDDGTIEYVSMFTGVLMNLRFTSDLASVEATVSSKAKLLEDADAAQVSDDFALENLVSVSVDGLEWETQSNGVYRITQVKDGAGNILDQGDDYTVSNLNGTGPATIRFTVSQAGSPGPRAAGTKWKLDKTIEYLVGLLCDEAGIPSSERTINSVIFPGGVSGSKTIDLAADWQAGTLTNIGATATPGSIKKKWMLLDDFADGNYTLNPTWTVLLNNGSVSVNGSNKFVVAASATYPTSVYTPFVKTSGTWQWKSSFSGSGTVNGFVYFAANSISTFLNFVSAGGFYLKFSLASGTKSVSLYRGVDGASDVLLATYTAATVHDERTWRVTKDASGNFTVYMDGVSVMTATDTTEITGAYFILQTTSSSTLTIDDIYWSEEVDGVIAVDTSAAIWISAEQDLLAAPISWGVMRRDEVLNGGSVAYKTAVATSSGGSYDAYVAISGDGQINSALKRYLKIKVEITSASYSLVSPEVQRIIANFSTSTVFLSVANFSAKSCFAAIQRLAQLCNYEWGFDGDGNFFFRSKTVSGDGILDVSYHNVIERISDYNPGWQDVVNVGRVRYNDYIAEYDGADAGEASPTSEQIYGRRVLDEDLSDMLLANDASLADARARTIYEDRSLPRGAYRASGRFVPWLEVSDVLNLTAADDPLLLEHYAGDPMQAYPRPMPAGPATNLLANDLRVKIIGLTPNPDQHTAEYILQGVLS